MKIEVLGAGCSNCNKLWANVRTAVIELGISAGVEKITDFAQISGYGVMMLPALVVDGKLVLEGKVASVEDVKKVLKAKVEGP